MRVSRSNGRCKKRFTAWRTLAFDSLSIHGALPISNQGTLVASGVSAINGSLTGASGSTLRVDGNGNGGNAVVSVENAYEIRSQHELTCSKIVDKQHLNERECKVKHAATGPLHSEDG